MAHSLIDDQVERVAAPSAPAPATPSSAVPTGGQVTYALKVKEKVGNLFGSCWHSPIQLTVAGDDVTITGAYWGRELLGRLYWSLAFILTGFAVALLGGVLIETSAEESTGSDVGVAIFIGGLILASAATTMLAFHGVREKRKARTTPRVHVFPGSAVTFMKLERYGSPVLVVLSGWLLWRLLFSRVRGLRITAPFNPDKPSAPETYRLVARNKQEAAALAQALLDSGASPPN